VRDEEDAETWKMVCQEWDEDQKKLEAERLEIKRLEEAEAMIQDVRNMNPNPFKTHYGRRVGFTTPIEQAQEMLDRKIRLDAMRQGKIILGRM